MKVSLNLTESILGQPVGSIVVYYWSFVTENSGSVFLVNLPHSSRTSSIKVVSFVIADETI